MKRIIHKAKDRGIQDHGWLKAAHSFSFGQYHDPSKVHFGLLRVLNDDVIAPGMGFGTHGHDNMEIITIPLSGKLAHRDSLGSEGFIGSGEVQIMSAGTGIQHSEYNGSTEEAVNLLQVWVFPKERNIKPRYDQKAYGLEGHHNSFQTVVSPDKEAGAVWINQDAYLSLGTFDEGLSASYSIKHPGNGAYVFIIEGKAAVGDTEMVKRDAAGIYDTDRIDIKVNERSKILVIEVPME